MVSPPRGIEIGNGAASRKRIWIVGKELGQGACATVCDLTNEDGSSTEFAIKLAPVPKKTTKKGSTPEEQNATLIHYEHLIYTTQFQHLQGKIIPSLPNGPKEPPSTGKESGFIFFVMEKMASTVSAIVPELLKTKPSTKKISFGPVAVRLLTCVQAVHDQNNIIRDVKTENFMLACGPGEGSSYEEKAASRVRLIDLALATAWTTTYGDTDEADSLVGTPLYASLNVHAGKKSSYRDDLEALGYVIAELLAQVYTGDLSKQLPWFQGKSDDEIAAMKTAQVDDPKSDFYRHLGNDETIAVFSEYMDVVRGLTFRKKPDYGELSNILSKLNIPTSTKYPTTAMTKKKTSRGAASAKAPEPAEAESSVGTKRRTREQRTPVDSASCSRQKSTRRTKEPDMDIDDDGSIQSEAGQDMDWELTVNENEEPQEDSKRPIAKLDPSRRSERVVVNERSMRRRVAPREVKDEVNVIRDDGDDAPEAPSKLRHGLLIEVIEGPHVGEFFELVAGSSDTLVLGSDPSSRVGTMVALKKDKSLDATHVRLDLNSKNHKSTTLTITDKSKKGTTSVNRLAVKSTKGFVNDMIKIGNTVLKIKSL